MGVTDGRRARSPHPHPNPTSTHRCPKWKRVTRKSATSTRSPRDPVYARRQLLCYWGARTYVWWYCKKSCMPVSDFIFIIFSYNNIQPNTRTNTDTRSLSSIHSFLVAGNQSRAQYFLNTTNVTVLKTIEMRTITSLSIRFSTCYQLVNHVQTL